MVKKYYFILLFCCIATTLCYSVPPFQIASKRYPIPCDNEQLLFPYESSHDLFTKNSSIERLLFVIHSASYNAKQYYSNGLAMLDEVPAEKNRTLIIAPHFLKTKHVEKISNPDFLYWKVTPFWGSSIGFFENHDIRISAYEVVDTILANLIKSENFPNLREVVIMGHSAGGQMANRYAACNLFEDQIARPNSIHVKYVVMAPSSYVYFSKERPVKGSMTKFAVPEKPDSGYNNWAYGLDNLYSYHRRHHITTDQIIKRYPQKKILYLVGSKDNNGKEETLDKGPAAMPQGPNRLVRGRLYYNYLRYLYCSRLKSSVFFNQRTPCVR